jgi:multiple sugar transport system ATP-binding protein
MTGVSVQNLYKSYDQKSYVIEEINFNIEEGEFAVLVGPSGCGKSTILRMIAGLEDITKGKILIDDKIVNDIPPKDRDIAMVFQNYALYPHMTVYENMAFGLKIRKFNKGDIEERVKTSAKILGIYDLLTRRPKELSGGQRQRVALGRAIVRKPKVFLFDEPLSNLDAKLRVQIRTEISKLHSKLGTTIIYVTHDQTEAMTMGDRIILLNEGVVQQIDTPINIYNDPNNKFVAGFIGSPAMNFINGKLYYDGKFKFKSHQESLQIEILPSLFPGIEKYRDKDIILGIRPEHFEINKNKKSNLNSVKIKVEVIEPMGNETFIYFNIDDAQFTARLNLMEDLKIKTEIDLLIDSPKLKFFDSETGIRI